jgi:hypothetical protein
MAMDPENVMTVSPASRVPLLFRSMKACCGDTAVLNPIVYVAFCLAACNRARCMSPERLLAADFNRML